MIDVHISKVVDTDSVCRGTQPTAGHKLITDMRWKHSDICGRGNSRGSWFMSSVLADYYEVDCQIT